MFRPRGTKIDLSVQQSVVCIRRHFWKHDNSAGYILCEKSPLTDNSDKALSTVQKQVVRADNLRPDHVIVL